MTSHCLCGLSFTTNWQLINQYFFSGPEATILCFFLFLPVEPSSQAAPSKLWRDIKLFMKKSACSIVFKHIYDFTPTQEGFNSFCWWTHNFTFTISETAGEKKELKEYNHILIQIYLREKFCLQIRILPWVGSVENMHDCLTQVKTVCSHLKSPKPTLLPLPLLRLDSLPASFLPLEINETAKYQVCNAHPWVCLPWTPPFNSERHCSLSVQALSLSSLWLLSICTTAAK